MQYTLHQYTLQGKLYFMKATRYALWTKGTHGPARLALVDATTLEDAIRQAKEKAAKLATVNRGRVATDPASMWLEAETGISCTLDGTDPEECEDTACTGCAWCNPTPHATNDGKRKG